MELAIYNQQGQDTGRKATPNDEAFGVEVNEHVLYLDVKRVLATQRQGTQKSKERSEVSGSTRKLHKQKGGGGARIGDINSPVLVGGGRVFGPRPRTYNFKLNKKVKQLARKSALTSKLADQQIMVVENFTFEAPKTKEFVGVLDSLKLGDKKVLYVVATPDKNVALSLRNLPACRMAVAADLNTYSILNNNMLLLSEDSVEVVNNI